MTVEALVVFGCVEGHCSELMNAYSQYNPNFKRSVKRIERQAVDFAKDWTAPWFVNAVLPVAGWAVRQEADINLYKGMTLKIKASEPPMLGVYYSF